MDKETYFKPLVRGETTRVGKTLVVDGGMSTMSEDEIRKIFGYVPNNDGSEDHPYYHPIKLLTSRPQLDMLLAQYLEDEVWTGLNQQNFTQYDETFFEKNSLVMVYYQDGTYQAEPSIASFVYTEDYSCLSVRLRVDKPAAADTAVGQWLLFAGIAKSDMEGISVLEAYVENTTTATNALSFTGKVEQVEGNAMLMDCYDVDQFVQGVWVNLGDIDLNPKVGEEYVVTYEDMMMPSLPPRVTAITVTKA